MGTGDNSYMKELFMLARSIDKLTCGQARLDLNCDEERAFHLYITPDDGLYKDATFKFLVCIRVYIEINQCKRMFALTSAIRYERLIAKALLGKYGSNRK
jgi:hypothetical protein